MDLRRPRAADWAMAAAGAVLLASLFLPWYRTALMCVTAPCPTDDVTGWEALAVIDVWLAAAALLAIAALAATTSEAAGGVAIAITALAGLTGVIAAVLALVRLVDLPRDLETAGQTSAAPGAGVGLAAALGLAATAIAAMRDERPRGPVEERPVEVRPAPSPDGTVADRAGAPTYNRRR